MEIGPALNAEAGGGAYASQIYPVPAERRVRRVIEPERPHRRRHAWHGADDPRIVPSLRRCTQAVCLPPIAEQGCPHAVTIFIEARDAPIESTAHIILERYVTCRTGNIDRRAARCDLGHTGSADRAYVVGGRERGSHNRAGRSVRNHAAVAVHLINAIVRPEEHTYELQSLMRISYAV